MLSDTVPREVAVDRVLGGGLLLSRPPLCPVLVVDVDQCGQLDDCTLSKVALIHCRQG